MTKIQPILQEHSFVNDVYEVSAILFSPSDHLMDYLIVTTRQ